MKKVAAVFALALSATAADANPPRVAVIRVADVFKQLESTVLANEQFKAKQAAINQDSRLKTYHELSADLQLRWKALNENPPKIDEETRKRLAREYAIKLQEAKSVREDFESFRAERNREIDSEMVAGMKQRLVIIRDTAEQLAREEGYDWVFDSSGNTNTGMPLLLYAKHTNDLSERVLALLGKAEAPATPAPSAPSPQTSQNPR